MLGGFALLLVLIIATSFFVASEFALVSVRMTRIDQLISEGNNAARQVKHAIEHLQDYIAATQVGITMAALGLGVFGEPVISGVLAPVLEAILPTEWVKTFISVHGIAFAISYLTVTILEIVFGEVVPKIVARQRPEAAVFFIIRPLNFFALVFKPLIWIVNLLTNAVMRLLRMPSGIGHTSVHSVEELELLVQSSREAGVLEPGEEALLRRVFDLGDVTARQVMLPRTEVTGIPVDATLPQVVEIISRDRHSRFPVYDGDLDNILGVLHVKDIFLSIAQQAEAHPDLPAGELNINFSIRSLMREILKIPETVDVNNLLASMQQTGTHMAMIFDEYGGTSGIATLEDVVEEIVGEVRDEFEGQQAHPDIQVTPEGTIVNGLTAIDDVNERLGLNIESEADTIGGYVFETLGRKPELGDEIAASGYVMRVEQLDGLRIAEVRIMPRDRTPAQAANEE